MEPVTVGILMIVAMFALLVLGVPIGLAMGTTACIGAAMIIGLAPTLALLGQTAYETAITYDLSIVPLFVLMGYFASNSGLSEELYRACNTWLGHRRGGLALATIGGCGAFAAICGSSLATAATMSEVAMPEMRRYNYDDRLATGSIAAGGTIGILIPPSVILALYGILTETNIGHLFLAGFLPGLMTVLGFMITIAVITRINPALGPRGPETTMRQKLLALRDVWGMMALFTLVIGGIYLGVFTPTEAAGIGAAGALALAALRRRMSWALLLTCLSDTVKTTAMLFTILIGAILFNNLLILSNVADGMESWITGLDMPPMAIMLLILLIYLAMGCVLDALAMIILTIPIFFPIVMSLGFDPIWFGIIVVMVVELGLITPPVGMNVFVIKGMTKDITLGQIYAGVVPFCVAQIILIILIVIFPIIATWLPSTMGI
ncbi:MAG: TRAP transporter large permease [Alphaproteobacteria bacterium]|jgi:tripartite ATP-independent transporter DctM subunit|nr:TRAP transporter large permease [Alphaproteobacteria bacterium]MDP6624568.1 TRAP transporter large permease [Alphaproteobacteria bacterium]|tara:strand:+ start:526 stop:1830 length:1305 start_codon:yes stop_codon:yes gene_type:complete